MSHRLRILILLFPIYLLLTSCNQEQQEEVSPAPITPSNALESYLTKEDSLFQWEVRDSFQLDQVRAYDIQLTSQQWREHTWRHQLTVLVPEEAQYDGALLFITGGSNSADQPRWKDQNDETLRSFSQVAAKNQAVVAILRQVPNQPLYDNLTEDALISFTLHSFQNDGDYSWPLLFPMVKSAVKAMDAVQEFASESLKQEINRFLVSGASKRGWTTWLTGSQDARVTAIAPMVIDVLNMPVSLNYQIEVWKAYSPQIQDYVDLGIPQQFNTGKGDTITTMVDPYSYRLQLDMPKLIINGTNDEYWPVDAIKNYLDSIPGENYLLYVPNAGHRLGDTRLAIQALSAFFGYTLKKENYPDLEWDISEEEGGVNFTVSTSSGKLVEALLWSADSDDRDFRDEEWSSTSLEVGDKTEFQLQENFPPSGFKAFYMDLIYEDPNGGKFTESTRMFVTDDDEVFIK
ncbi:PhoPQ-activated pathogenicity-related family protein [Catalinimonas niigatensis]|uniref:PhoPQ-activated pathogenicity-related family protein n=1 Tax=Catalinimonas niigatensis TaxID=1397264 RepID=UPI00266553B5|nr:PhoPQ-activated protein PqaA family protein [Catalinimonas niigatensis]WPP50457.1 PhoPQ-activated protein PqaA family protein [Catalinimonas niigatensis]